MLHAMLRLLVFTSFLFWTYGLRDGGFKAFCTEQIAGKVSADKKECHLEQYPLKNVHNTSAVDVCQYRSRFAVKQASSDGKSLSCIWHQTGECDEGHYIHTYCYKLFRKCAGDWTLMPLNDRQAFRWMVLTFPAEQVVKVKLSNKDKTPAIKYSHHELLPLKDGERLKERAVLTSRMSAFGGYPGDIVFLAEGKGEEEVRSVCRKKAKGEPAYTPWQSKHLCVGQVGAIAKQGSGAFGYREIKSKDGKFVLIPLRNVYSPRLDGSGNIDFTYFHEVCEKFCDGCYAASHTYLNPSDLDGELGKGKFWIPGGRPPISPKSECKVKRNDGPEADKWTVLWHKRHRHTTILESSYWRSDLPNKLCSDQGRYAMAYQNGKVIDVPVFDRLPLVCVRGGDPRVPENANNCLKNSESNGKGGCKCKAGFKDAMTLEDQPELREYGEKRDMKEGYVCVQKDCRDETKIIDPPFDAVLFVIDGSASINNVCSYIDPNGINHICEHQQNFAKVQQFLHDGKTWLPRKLRTFFLQYSTTNNIWYASRRGETPENWDDDQYENAVNQAAGMYLYQNTPTYMAIEEMTNWWLATNPEPRAAIMVIITDGVPTVDSAASRRTDIIENARNNGIEIKYVAVGKFDFTLMKRDVLDENTDILYLDNYGELQQKVKSTVAKWIKCNKITEEQFDDAMKRPYE